MSNDEIIRQSVLEDLSWSPRVNAAYIGVAVRNGIVELSGHVETFAEKLEAEHVALAIRSVKGVAQEIIVRLPSEKRTDDNELADRAARLLSWDARLLGDRVKVKVERGWVTLTGQVRSAGERDFASSDVKRLSGVVGITNSISLRPAAAPSDVKGQLEDALGRRALLATAVIQVSAQDGTIHPQRARSLVGPTSRGAPRGMGCAWRR